MYHVAADNAFPYRLCSGQQESGSACISSRGNDGEITFRDWHPVALEEYGYVAPDPLDPDIVYGGKLTRYDRRTGQAQYIMPLALRTPDFRVVRTAAGACSRRSIRIFSTSRPTLSGPLATAAELGSRSAPTSPAKPGTSRPASASSPANVKPTQRGVIYAARALAPRHQSHLGRHRRWPHLAHHRRRR